MASKMDHNHSGKGAFIPAPDYPSETLSTTETAAMNDAANNFVLKLSLLEFGNRTSLNGPPFIIGAANGIVRSIWILLFVAGVGMTVYNGTENVIRFTSWEKQTDLTLDYAPLKFPTVTICNDNPLKRSSIKNMKEDLREFLAMINPNHVKRKGPEKMRNKRYIDEEYKNKRNRTFLPDNYRDHENVFGGEEDTANEILDTFRYHFSLEERVNRLRGGHQLRDMLQSCSFETRSCNESEFQLVLSTAMGNCYSFNVDGSHVSRRSGNQYGLSLMLYLELDEYIMGLTSGFGIRVTVQNQGLLPFPETDGIFASAGAETDIGLRMVNITRLPMPYGKCENHVRFRKTYNTAYSRQFCNNACPHTFILSECKCYEESNHRLYERYAKRDYQPCKTNKEIRCMSAIKTKHLNNELNCTCPSPCHEISFETQISSRMWPTPDYLNFLVDKVCRTGKNKKDLKDCNNLIAKNEFHKVRNFLKINVYYRELNFNVLTETPEYPWFTFLSDMGGALGLFLGISVIGVFEVFHLICILVYHLYRKCAMRGQMKRHTRTQPTSTKHKSTAL